ncbi:hypothetical protein GMRT_14121 [Giardia muris]|uniref:Uncharacterized protein n=1 Tax=Giardia muris TaxID=5742 RepID=A0A4Z1SRH6_GIAMU|nr:hypothetical protein GMRT_14121 [Giardia muris]|eukprot:TNJ28330.1 hypothetical protein GMRT_14121 [Giardia muris]
MCAVGKVVVSTLACAILALGAVLLLDLTLIFARHAAEVKRVVGLPVRDTLVSLDDGIFNGFRPHGFLFAWPLGGKTFAIPGSLPITASWLTAVAYEGFIEWAGQAPQSVACYPNCANPTSLYLASAYSYDSATSYAHNMRMYLAIGTGLAFVLAASALVGSTVSCVKGCK